MKGRAKRQAQRGRYGSNSCLLLYRTLKAFLFIAGSTLLDLLDGHLLGHVQRLIGGKFDVRLEGIAVDSSPSAGGHRQEKKDRRELSRRITPTPNGRTGCECSHWD